MLEVALVTWRRRARFTRSGWLDPRWTDDKTENIPS